MLRYKKGKQPQSLTQRQATPNADWRSSREIRVVLLADQGHLCAYCQRRIPCTMNQTSSPGMRVEHWLAQSSFKNSDLQWSNLLAVCPGNPRMESGTPSDEVHCDSSRGNHPLFLHPVEGQGPDPLRHLSYNHEGKARPADTSCNQESVEIDIHQLNLNCHRLRQARRELHDLLVKKLQTEQFSPTALRQAYRKYAPRQGQPSPQFCEVARHYLRRWARKKKIELE